MLGFKARAPRKKVQLRGRLRDDNDWKDVTIKDVSEKGLMAEASDPPARGHYIEIRRFDKVVVGRVVWSNRNRFGITTREKLDIASLIKGTRERSGPEPRNLSARQATYRRVLPSEFDGWRRMAHAVERFSVFLFGLAGIGFIGVLFIDAIGAPAEAVERALKRSQQQAEALQ